MGKYDEDKIKGARFGKLVAIEPVSGPTTGGATNSHTRWRCVCDCGGETTPLASNLLNGQKTCGCYRITHGGTHNPAYNSWWGIVDRCTNPDNKDYVRYGARGITVCDRWRDSFNAFLEDMGPRPGPGYSVDRIKNHIGYEPGNCRWATAGEQQNNRTNNRRFEFDGRSQTIAQWAREIGVSRQALRYRLDNGWTVEQALTIPFDHTNDIDEINAALV